MDYSSLKKNKKIRVFGEYDGTTCVLSVVFPSCLIAFHSYFFGLMFVLVAMSRILRGGAQRRSRLIFFTLSN